MSPSVIDGDLFPTDFWEPDRHEELEATNFTCELATYDARFDQAGKRFLLEVRRTDGNEYWDGDDDYDTSAALIFQRFFNRQGRLEYTELLIRSQQLCDALRCCVKSYPGVDFSTDVIKIRNTPRCLFFYYRELEEYGRNRQDVLVTRYMIFFLRYIGYRFRAVNQAFPGFMKGLVQKSSTPSVDWQNLWIFYRPGTLVYRQATDGAPLISKIEAFRICECDRYRCAQHNSWTVTVLNIQYVGKKYEWVRTELNINKFDGYRSLETLSLVPLESLPSRTELCDRLLKRAAMYLGLSGIHYKYYKGVARFTLSSRQTVFRQAILQCLLASTKKVTGRFMIDLNAYAEAFPKPARRYNDDDDDNNSDYGDFDRVNESLVIEEDESGKPKLIDDELLACTHQVAGYSLQYKLWALLDVEHLDNIDFNANAFDRLVLPDETKTTMKALIENHGRTGKDDFDDVIKGKGRGLIFLLHGVPGAGKTLTAESIADTLKKPLYTITSGDLGVEPTHIEQALSEILQLATRWEAIVLIDEADVFLSQRNVHNVEHNALVSVLLRTLEYYEGVMILTTNRVKAIDTAFLSRIHLAVRYDDHTQETRRKLWANFVGDIPSKEISSDVNAAAFEELSAHPLNGRQVKNCMRIAIALARGHRRQLCFADLRKAAQDTLGFRSELQNSVDGEKGGSSELEPDPEANDLENRPAKRKRLM